MPKKKKKGGSKKEKTKAATNPSPGEIGLREPEVVPQNTKEFYLLQIQDLEERLGRYRRQCDILKQHNEDLRDNVQSKEQDMKGIISTISDENERLTAQVIAGTEQVQDLNQRLEEEKREAEQQLISANQKGQEEKELLLIDLRNIQRQNELTEEFREQKQNMDNKLLQLEETIELQKQEFEDSLYEVEKKKVISQERLKKEMMERVKEASQDFKRASEKQMSETTKRAIRENISISNQLIRISAKNEELISQNDILKQKLHRINLDRSGLENSFHEVTRKNVSQLRNLELLITKLETTDAQLRQFQAERGQFEQIQIDYTDLEIINSELASDAQNHFQQNATLREKLEKACEERDAARAQNENLLRILSRSASLVNSALRPSSDPAHTFSQREDFMISLLEILETAKLHAGKIRQLSDNPSERVVTPAIFSVPLPGAESSKYKPGNLGFVSIQSTSPILPPI
ncbi:hypothetical protein LOD99_12496 [Oopsacas minuta]|uniref:Cilia- and flagella-associated protein 157 n=1 Tax=Oopsacas minuta TaxID=111878 RepID=A0AAV7JCB0_9METZ|nr:hypothetical protein LOD99_12496 [Oopsacas minuta]